MFRNPHILRFDIDCSYGYCMVKTGFFQIAVFVDHSNESVHVPRIPKVWGISSGEELFCLFYSLYKLKEVNYCDS